MKSNEAKKDFPIYTKYARTTVQMRAAAILQRRSCGVAKTARKEQQECINITAVHPFLLKDVLATQGILYHYR